MIQIGLFVCKEKNFKYYVENIRRHRNKISSPGRQGNWMWCLCTWKLTLISNLNTLVLFYIYISLTVHLVMITHSFQGFYFNSLHVSSNLVLIIRRINCILSDLHTKRSPTQSDTYQMLYWYSWFSWLWARGCSKHADNWNKNVEKNCASGWSFTKKH